MTDDKAPLEPLKPEELEKIQERVRERREPMTPREWERLNQMQRRNPDTLT